MAFYVPTGAEDSASVGIGVSQVHGARAAEDQQVPNHGGDLKKKNQPKKTKTQELNKNF